MREDPLEKRRVQSLRKRPLGRYRYVRLRWRMLFAVIDFVGAAVFGAGRRVRKLLLRRTTIPPEQQDDPKVILLVQLDHLGDAIISTAMLPALRERYPHASIEVLAGPCSREVFEASPEVDRVHVSRVNRFVRRPARLVWILATLWWGLRLRRRRVDLALDVRGDFPVAVILWLCGARRRVGWACGGGGFLLTDRVDFVAGRPEVDSRWALLAKLGISTPEDTHARWPSFQTPQTARRQVARHLAESSAQDACSRTSRRVVLHVGAGTRAKSWPVDHWRELLGRIIVAHGAQVVLVGGGKDRIIAREILGGLPWPGVDDWTARLTVVELAALLEWADVLVGADSGPAHLAAAVGTPAVVLFSGTNSPRQWRPCGQQVTVVSHRVDCSPCHRERCPRTDHPCMKRLPPERVAAEVEKVLNNTPCGRRDRSAVAGPIV